MRDFKAARRSSAVFHPLRNIFCRSTGKYQKNLLTFQKAMLKWHQYEKAVTERAGTRTFQRAGGWCEPVGKRLQCLWLPS
ncbi:hypothetical protein OBV_20890 [Oscillibacter valericigenes Sjm18-20]|nr:hypothetical protein OBV_20890 [Oscillibacter valericigenes Sjm18-20]